MNDHPILAQVALGYSPLIDRRRAVIATRLTVFPERPDAAPDAAALLAALDEVWPASLAGGAAEAGAPALSLNLRPLDPAAVQARSAAAGLQPVSLNLAGEALLAGVMAAQPPSHLMIEVPAFLAGDAAHAAAIDGLHAHGSVLLIKGRPLAELSPQTLGAFAHAIVDGADELAQPPGGLSAVQAGVRTLGGVEAAFARGAIATLGWPLDDPMPATSARGGVPPDVQVVLELIAGVDREEPPARLEVTLRKDPTLAFRLLRYLNSPGFGLSVEVQSFGHALMMLGHQRLKRWLALLLASSSKAPIAQPLMYAAVRRGLLMEELGRQSDDAEFRGEMFICGVFSLLDRLLQQPFAELLKHVPVPERVRQALLRAEGPFQPYLDLVRAIEAESVWDIREAGERLLLSPLAVNRALLSALAAARSLDQ